MQAPPVIRWAWYGDENDKRFIDYWIIARGMTYERYPTLFLSISNLIYFKYCQIKSHLKIDTVFIEKKLNSRIREIWIPFPNVTIDELIIKFKGRYKYVS